MAIRVSINGFGRIGRIVYRVLATRGDEFEVAAVNDLADAQTLAILLKYDSVHRRFPGEVSVKDGSLVVNGKKIKVLSERDPANLPWKEMKIDFVVESTGVFRYRKEIAKHIEAGAKKVLLTVPPRDDIDAMIVLGVNEDDLTGEEQIISNASCTTNCVVPMAKVVNDSFGIEHGLMTTIHAYTNDQRILDLIHKDPRRARAAAVNIIPTTTGAARAAGEIIPELEGKIDGMAMRVPVSDGSVTDLVTAVKKEVSAEEVNAAFRAAAGGPLKGIIEYTEDPIVSSDVVGNPASCVFDAQSTMVIDSKLVKTVGWYDNEWGYSNRVVDLMALVMEKAK
ncbi:MAG: glyceraldehyde-3-phosphate dehydrogenase [Planctomycetes bacterium DG_23]|nr:MAG: glyceraldehyde-3-phosphate dehydrogenase [Planctomycetes bacterium DG_23]